MKRAIALSLLTLVLAATSFGPSSHAQAATKDERVLTVDGGVIYEPLQGSPATAGYGTLINHSNQAIEILGISVAGFKASEIHATVEENGLMKMKKLASVLIEPKGQFELKPGGNHIMLFEANRKFKTSETIPVTLVTRAAKFTLLFKIEKRPIAAWNK